MKTIINILRSIITSLLFLILIGAVIIQFAFTIIRLNDKTIPDLVEPETILKMIKPAQKLDDKSTELAKEYIRQYINYVFYKRSFPSVQDFDYKDLTVEEKHEYEKILIDIRSKIDMKYESVLALRNLNNFLSNGSIYLLINIATLVIILLILISSGKISKTLTLSGIGITLSGLITLIASTVGTRILSKKLNPLEYNFVTDIIDEVLLKKIFNQSLIYIGIGFLIFSISFILTKYIFKKQN